MKRKRNHSLRSSVFIFLAALFLLFTCSVSTIYASTLQKPDIAASGKFVKTAITGFTAMMIKPSPKMYF